MEFARFLSRLFVVTYLGSLATSFSYLIYLTYLIYFISLIYFIYFGTSLGGSRGCNGYYFLLPKFELLGGILF